MPLSLRLLLCVSLGVAGGVLAEPARPGLITLWLATSAGLAWLAHRHRWTRARDVMGAAVLVCTAWLLGIAAVDRAWHPPLRTLLEQRLGGFAIDANFDGRLDEPVPIEGVIVRDASSSGPGAVLQIAVRRVWTTSVPERAPGGVSLTIGGVVTPQRLDEWRAGRTVRLPATLRRPARYLNAGVPDGERALARRGVALVGTVKSGALVEVVAPGGWASEAAGAIRAAVRTAMARHVTSLDDQSGAVATAILIGDRAALAPDEERRLQEAGTYHVIAISGGNIALLTGLLLAVLWASGIRGAAAATVAIVVITAFAFIVGGGPSVVRATAMASVYLALRIIDQRTSPLHAIALTASSMLVVDPLEIVDAGFWLTFGATSAIVAGLGRASRAAKPQARASYWRAPLILCLSSLCAELALLPVSALVFQRISVAGLVLNLAAVPSMGVVQGAAGLTVIAATAGADEAARFVGRLTHLAAQGLLRSAGLVDFMPWTTWRVPSPWIGVVALYYLAILAWFLCSRPPVDSRRRRLGTRAAASVAACALAWIVVAPHTLVRARGDGRLYVTVMDVGQGDALLVTFPNGRTMGVDSGGVSASGDFDIGDRVLGPALRARGLRSLDYLVVTHPDPDHVGGAASLVREFNPREVWMGIPVAGHEPSRRLRETAAAARASWRELGRGHRLDVGGVEIRVLHPPPPDWERQRVRNDDSVVLELRMGEVSVLLTGDIEREAERALAPTLDLLPTVVLKSPHHGSATSSSAEFLAAVKPSVVLISCGRGNPYGHPVAAVMERYRDIGAAVFRTDREGQLEVVIDGTRVEVSAFSGRTWLSR